MTSDLVARVRRTVASHDAPGTSRYWTASWVSRAVGSVVDAADASGFPTTATTEP